MIKIKGGVKIDLLRPQALLALAVAEQVYREEYEVDCVLTSGNDGRHKVGSKHYQGNAVDIRVWNLPNGADDGHQAAALIAKSLGDNYDVIFELDHIHIEYDPDMS